MRFEILGPLGVRGPDGPVALGTPKNRAVLAVLLARRQHRTSAAALADAVWSGRIPKNGPKNIQVNVHRLRRALGGGDRIRFADGYQLVLADGELDAWRAQSLARRAELAHSAEESGRLLREALALWQGDPYAGYEDLTPIRPEAERLTELRMTLLERRIDADLSAGHHTDLIAELSALTTEHPLRERLHARLMLALYRSGRRAEALSRYHHARRTLITEIGLGPGPELRTLEQRIITADPSLLGPPPTCTCIAARLPTSEPKAPPPSAPAPPRTPLRLVPDPPRPARRITAPLPPAQPPLGRDRAAAPDTTHPSSAEPNASLQSATAPPRRPRQPSTPPAPAQLTPPLRTFTGRPTPLAHLDAALDSGQHVLALVGTGGVGKTALAVHWAHRIRSRFPDGQLYVDLRGAAQSPPLRTEQVLARFLPALGLPTGRVPDQPDDAAALYRSALHGRRVLVLLDNASGASQVRPLLPPGAGSLALVTSRNSLRGLVARDDAHTLTLKPLPPPEALALLERLLGEQTIRAERTAAAELARRCDHLPLALRIAAARITTGTNRVGAIGSLLARLTEQHILDELSLDDDPGTAVRHSIDRSYAPLPPEQKRLFRLLSLLPDRAVSPETAALRAARPVPRTRRLLDQLAASHLIESPAPDHYRLTGLLRVYATEHVARTDLPPQPLNGSSTPASTRNPAGYG
ncbi:BTAD domain-containing putative transcriptional regulator [Streptomyces sp. NPDC048825]|uniref:AfsR/SARP family transcriptional regulator n=1 Tax=Streptomyces sp. NPDC048825 TaxID=3365592 RepID=UPI00371A7F60